MKSKFAAFALLLSAVFTMASCLGDNDTYTYTDDSAITSFSVTGAKRYQYVKTSDGLRDSIVTSEVSLSDYKFYIDQVTHEIYNPDSLPCGVDAKKLIVSATSQNSGLIVIKSVSSDSIDYLTTDSTDFSVDRQLQVVSNSGKSLRKYTVRVNVHKEMPDSFAWHAVPECDAMKQLTDVRVVATSDGLLLFGTDGNATQVLKGSVDGWKACTPDFNHQLAADAYRGVVTKEGRAYVSVEGDIMSTTNGTNWIQTGTATGITRLVAASSFRLYGYAADGRLMASADNGNTWTVATIDEDLALLPTAESAYVAMPMNTYDKTERVLLIGTRDAAKYPNDKALTVWSKIDEGAANSEDQTWAYYNITEDNKHTAPLLSCISAVAYDDAVYVLGKKEGAAPAFYKTRDNGITWNADTVMTVPADFSDNAQSLTGGFAVAVDSNKSLWIVNAASGKAWRGRINRLGWKKEQTKFTE